jgi:enoyl-CoA hydratase
MTEYANILVERRGAVTLVTLNRPDALNALNPAGAGGSDRRLRRVRGRRSPALRGADRRGEKAFAAGADIKELAEKPAADFFREDYVLALAKPLSSRRPASRGSPRSTASRSAAGASWR